MKIIILIVIAVIAVAAGIVFFTGNDTNNQSVDTDTGQTQNQNTQQESSANETFTIVQVAAHNTATDCWTVIRGNVYNVTSYISAHPGGEEILRACGTDATRLFETRTTEDGEAIGNGEPHSSDAHSILEQYKIGIIAE